MLPVQVERAAMVALAAGLFPAALATVAIQVGLVAIHQQQLEQRGCPAAAAAAAAVIRVLPAATAAIRGCGSST